MHNIDVAAKFPVKPLVDLPWQDGRRFAVFDSALIDQSPRRSGLLHDGRDRSVARCGRAVPGAGRAGRRVCRPRVVSVPVIAVPAQFATNPNDVYSSLRMPSDVPMATLLSPANAIQMALQVFSLHSPKAYAARRSIVESYTLSQGNSPTFLER